jgi:hypothetical protein
MEKLFLISVLCWPLSSKAGYFPEIPPTDTLYVISRWAMNSAEALMITSLQGIVAKTKPLIYVSGGNYTRWVEDLEENYGVTVISDHLYDPWWFIDKFGAHVNGYILYNLGSNSVNVAITLAGIYDCVCIDESIESRAQSYGLSLYMDVRGKDEEWAFANYWDSVRHDLIIQQEEGMCEFLSDYGVATRCFTYYDGNSSFMEEVLDSVEDDCPQLGWGDASQGEDGFIRPATQRGVFTIPANICRNLSVLSSFDVELKQSTHSDPQTQPGKHYVTFLLSDGDNIQWIINSYTASPWYGSSSRGKFSMGWPINPSLVELAPTVMAYLYRHASTGANKDFFLAAISGMGYFYPDYYPDLELHCERLNEALKKADFNLVSLMAWNYPEGFNEDVIRPYLKQPNVMGGFFYFYAPYSGARGAIKWLYGKPMVGIRFTLWRGFTTPSELASEINAMPKNPSRVEGYSAVSVHCWSMSMDSIKAVVDQLDPDVVVVTPEEFIKLIIENLKGRFDFLDIPANNATLTVTDVGSIGFDRPEGNGSGFVYPAGGDNTLYYGSMAFGNSSSYLVDNWYISGSEDCDRDWQITTSPNGRLIWVSPPIRGDTMAVGYYNDSGLPTSKNVVCEQYAWGFTTNSNCDDFVILSYKYTNYGTSPISGLYSAIFCDFDIGDPSQDNANINEAKYLAWVFDGNVYVGVTLLDSLPMFKSASTIANPTYIHPNDGMTDEDKFKFMNRSLHFGQQTSSDYSVMVSVGPFDLAPNASKIVAFAIVGGTSQTEIEEHADAARECYQRVGVEEKNLTVSRKVRLEVMPNLILNTNTATITFSLPTISKVTIGIYDIAGRLVKNLVESEIFKAGIHQLEWDISGAKVSSGVFFVRLKTAEGSGVEKIVLF